MNSKCYLQYSKKQFQDSKKVFHSAIAPRKFSTCPVGGHEKERTMTRKDLLFLQSKQEYPSISIILNVTSAMRDREQNRIKVKNAIQKVRDQLLQEFAARDIKKLMDNLQALADTLNLEHTNARAIALFVNQNLKEIYYLPTSVHDKVAINAHFDVRDIIHVLNRIPKFWVLALSEKPSRLFYGIRDTLSEIIEPIKDTMGQDQDGFPYTYLPPDVESLNDMYKGSGRMQVSSGHTGDGTRVLPIQIDERYVTDHKRKFFERVFMLAKRFLEPEHLPLVIVADEKNYGFMEKIAKDYGIARWVRGDYCKRTAHDIEQVVWPEVSKYLEEERQKKLKEFTEQAMGTTSKHAFGMESVWRAAQEGRIKDLLVEENLQVSGIVNPDNKFNFIQVPKQQQKEIPHEDMVNLLIDAVLNKGDKTTVTFYAPETLKQYGHVAAILRY